jgi:hypothetical protein
MRHDGRVQRRWLLVLALPAAGLLPVVGAADAASCKAMAVGYAFDAGDVIGLEPEHVAVAYRGCVQFTNNLDFPVSITVAGGYSATLGPKESTPPGEAYVGKNAGRHDVTARSGVSSADGTITVAAAPTHASAPTTAAPPKHRSSPAHSPATRPSSSSTGPRLAPAPPTAGGTPPRAHRATPPPTAPSVAPTAPRASVAPQPSASPSAPAVVAFPIEPPSGRGAGLPGALAALAVVGTGAGLVRVLLAEPVGPVDDAGRTVGGAA